MIETNRIVFLNTLIDNITAKEAKECVDILINTHGNHYVVTPNTDIVVKMSEDNELKTICETADLILTDGQILVNISKKCGIPIKERVCMTDFVWDIFDLAVCKNYGIFMFGGKEEVLTKAINNVKKQISNINIIDSYSPPFGFENDKKELEKAINKIKNSNADILLVFLGCPKQEKFIFNYKDQYKIPISITMGGCVDFLANNVKRAPKLMQKVGLEWFYRFLQEPKRMFKRYFIDDIKIFKLARKYKYRNE